MNPELDRRDFGLAALAAAVTGAVLTHHDEAGAQTVVRPPPSPALLATPAERSLAPLPFAPASLQGLSERLLTSHHQNNYGGAVRKLNEVRAQLASADPATAGPYWSLYGSLRAAELNARNSAFLHELYFANLAAGQSVPAALGAALSQRFGSVERFQAQLRGAAKAASGWVVLAGDPSSHTLELVQTESHGMGSWDARPLLVLDVYEHAFALDYGADKNAYLDAFWRNVAWAEVHSRLQRFLAHS